MPMQAQPVCPALLARSSVGACSLFRCAAGSLDHDSSSSTPCEPCDPGSFVPRGSVGQCSSFACTSGTSDDDRNASTPCVVCNVGAFVPAQSTGACGEYACAAGQIDADQNTSTPCSPCRSGWTSSIGSVTCSFVECAGLRGYESTNQSCRCRPGYVGCSWSVSSQQWLAATPLTCNATLLNASFFDGTLAPAAVDGTSRAACRAGLVGADSSGGVLFNCTAYIDSLTASVVLAWQPRPDAVNCSAMIDSDVAASSGSSSSIGVPLLAGAAVGGVCLLALLVLLFILIKRRRNGPRMIRPSHPTPSTTAGAGAGEMQLGGVIELTDNPMYHSGARLVHHPNPLYSPSTEPRATGLGLYERPVYGGALDIRAQRAETSLQQPNYSHLLFLDGRGVEQGPVVTDTDLNDEILANEFYAIPSAEPHQESVYVRPMITRSSGPSS
eukprot:m.104445 g.104445  ORF g.104445 m.104445 type:complete len:441 (+) comp14175_c0_seq1:4242-5564(+)